MDKASFMSALKRDSRYANYNSQEREQLWADHKELAKQERLVSTRGLLGVNGPTIDLNTCSMDHLERVPKLTQPVRKAIIVKRNNLPGQRYTSWEQLHNIAGLGATMLESMKCFCHDPSTRPGPVPDQVGPQSVAAASSSSGTKGNHVLMVGQNSVGHLSPLLTLWTQSGGMQPGDVYQDSGCSRCVGGHETHVRWQKWLL